MSSSSDVNNVVVVVKVGVCLYVFVRPEHADKVGTLFISKGGGKTLVIFGGGGLGAKIT